MSRRNHHAVTAMTGPTLAISPLSRTCPKCEAQPSRPCRRWVGGRVCGKDVGGGYWKPLKNVHEERRAHRQAAR